MKKFTKISLIVAAAMLAAGLLLSGIAAMLGAGYGTMHQMSMDGAFDVWGIHVRPYGIYLGPDNNLSIGLGTDNEIIIGDDGDDAGTYQTGTAFNASEVNNISVDVDAASIYVKPSADEDEIRVDLQHGQEKYYSCVLDGDTLQIRYDQKNYRYHRKSPEITIYLPSDKNFGTLDFVIGAAEMEFDDQAISCERLTIDVGAGSLEAERFDVTELLDIEIGAGEVNVDSGTFGEVKIDCAMGSVELSGKLNGDLTGSCSMGSIEIELDGNEEDYNYDLTCSMGEMTVNGRTRAAFDGTHTEKNENAVGTISMDCSMGSVELTVR